MTIRDELENAEVWIDHTHHLLPDHPDQALEKIGKAIKALRRAKKKIKADRIT